MSMARYVLTIFPVFYILFKVTQNPWVKRAVVYLFFALSLFLSGHFFRWGWVA